MVGPPFVELFGRTGRCGLVGRGRAQVSKAKAILKCVSCLSVDQDVNSELLLLGRTVAVSLP